MSCTGARTPEVGVTRLVARLELLVLTRGVKLLSERWVEEPQLGLSDSFSVEFRVIYDLNSCYG